jgi:hypothetical protein
MHRPGTTSVGHSLHEDQDKMRWRSTTVGSFDIVDKRSSISSNKAAPLPRRGMRSIAHPFIRSFTRSQCCPLYPPRTKRFGYTVKQTMVILLVKRPLPVLQPPHTRHCPESILSVGYRVVLERTLEVSCRPSKWMVT